MLHNIQSGFLMRLAALLTSSSERVQLSVCRALNNLLTMPEVRSRVAEKAQVCTPASVQVRSSCDSKYV